MTPNPRLLHNKICEEDPDYARNFLLLLRGTIRPSSPASALRGAEPPLRLVRSYLRPEWDATTYRVRMTFCGFCCQNSENPFVEALAGCGGIVGNRDESAAEAMGLDEDEGKASLYSQTIVSSFGPLKTVVEAVCEEKNEDGTYLTDVQIRDRYHQYMMEKCTVEPEYRGRGCPRKGACGVLPGDTVYWEDDYCSGLTMTRFEPATEEELIERGWLAKGGAGGRYAGWARAIREEKARKKRTIDESKG